MKGRYYSALAMLAAATFMLSATGVYDEWTSPEWGAVHMIREAKTSKDCEWAYRRALAEGLSAAKLPTSIGMQPVQMEISPIYTKCMSRLEDLGRMSGGQ